MVTELLCINYRDKRALYFNLASVSQGKNDSEIATEYADTILLTSAFLSQFRD